MHSNDANIVTKIVNLNICSIFEVRLGLLIKHGRLNILDILVFHDNYTYLCKIQYLNNFVYHIKNNSYSAVKLFISFILRVRI